MFCTNRHFQNSGTAQFGLTFWVSNFKDEICQQKKFRGLLLHDIPQSHIYCKLKFVKNINSSKLFTSTNTWPLKKKLKSGLGWQCLDWLEREGVFWQIVLLMIILKITITSSQVNILGISWSSAGSIWLSTSWVGTSKSNWSFLHNHQYYHRCWICVGFVHFPMRQSVSTMWMNWPEGDKKIKFFELYSK